MTVLAWTAGCQPSPTASPLADRPFVSELSIGKGADDPEGLSQVKGLHVTARGDVWVLEASTHDIRVFDSTGRPLRRIGRRGQGPGELLWPDGMAAAPDGVIWVHDPQNGRFTLFAPTGDFVRQQPAPAQGYGWLWRGGIDDAGRVWDQLIEPTEEGAPERLRRASAGWSQVDTLELPSCLNRGRKRQDAFYSKPIEGTPLSRYAFPVPFYPAPVQAFDWRSGAVWCAPSGAEYRLIKLDIESMDTLGQVVAAAQPVEVGAGERDSAIGALRKFLAERGEPDVDWRRIPSVKPIVAGALVDDAGRLWVQRSYEDATSRFDLYSETGQPIAAVRVPFAVSRGVPPVVRGNQLWLVGVDADGVPYVVRGHF